MLTHEKKKIDMPVHEDGEPVSFIRLADRARPLDVRDLPSRQGIPALDGARIGGQPLTKKALSCRCM